MSSCRELTIDEVMADSMIRAQMNADKVDPVAFESLLRSLSAAGSTGGDGGGWNRRPSECRTASSCKTA